MSVVAVGTVRDEADIIGTTVVHMLAEVDLVILEDHLSVDATPHILAALDQIYPGRLLLQRDPSPLFDQAGRMNALARLARDRGADWIVPFDADEIWYSPTGRPLRELLPELPADVCAATVWEHTPDAADPTAIFRRRHVLPWPWVKVCYRPTYDTRLWIGQHGVDGAGERVDHDAVAMRHLPWRSEAQARRRVHRDATDELGGAAGLHTLNTSLYRGYVEDEAQFLGLWATVTTAPWTDDPVPVRLPALGTSYGAGDDLA
jgi:hypothetical protein